jgi:cytochrome c oxidase assembly protein subunit 11
VVPWQATPHFSKADCFCFQRQTLAGGESAELPLRFLVTPDLPPDTETLTISYTFMALR